MAKAGKKQVAKSATRKRAGKAAVACKTSDKKSGRNAGSKGNTQAMPAVTRMVDDSASSLTTTGIGAGTASTAADDRHRLALDARVTIQTIGALQSALEAAPAVIDASAVQHVDTAALQLLVAYANSARAAGRDIHWSADDGELPHALALAGLGCRITFASSQVADADIDDLCPVF